MAKRVFLIGVLVIWGLACGKKEAPAAEAPAEPAPAPAPSAPAAEAPKQSETDSRLADLKAKQEAAGGPINWKQLVAFLPDQIGGFKASRDAEGMTQDLGNGAKMSSAHRAYKDGERSMRIAIGEAALSPALMMMKNNLKIDRDSSSGFTKTIEVAGHPALFSWDMKRAESSLQVLAGDRAIDLRINKATSAEDAQTIGKLLAIDELAKLKGEPAQ